MHAPSLIHESFAPQRHQYPRHRSAIRNLRAHLRGSSRGENLVATFSLVAIVLIVLALVYQTMSI